MRKADIIEGQWYMSKAGCARLVLRLEYDDDLNEYHVIWRYPNSAEERCSIRYAFAQSSVGVMQEPGS